MFDNILGSVMNNPLFLGMALKVGMDAAKQFFKNVDASGVVQQAKGWLEPSLVALAFVVEAGRLAMSGHLADVNLDAVVNFVTMYLGMRSAGTITTNKMVAALKSKIVK